MIFGVCSRHVLNTGGLGSDLEAIERKMQGKARRSGRKKLGEKFRKFRGMTIAISGRARPMSNEFRYGNCHTGKSSQFLAGVGRREMSGEEI
jgi:hypothetical protein